MVKRYIRRHRLEKKDPNAAMSEPVKPIEYWVDPGRAGRRARRRWSKARAGGTRRSKPPASATRFKVAVLPEGADPMDIRYNMINWVHRSTRGWSTGGTVADPRTGEIIKAHGDARLAARPPGLPDLRRPALALHHRQREARHSVPDGAGAHPPAGRARSGPHARPGPQLLRQHRRAGSR